MISSRMGNRTIFSILLLLLLILPIVAYSAPVTITLPEKKVDLQSWYSPYSYSFSSSYTINGDYSYSYSSRDQTYNENKIAGSNQYDLNTYIYYHVLVYPNGTEKVLDEYILDNKNYTQKVQMSKCLFEQFGPNIVQVACPAYQYFSNHTIPEIETDIEVEDGQTYQILLKRIQVPAATTMKYQNLSYNSIIDLYSAKEYNYYYDSVNTARSHCPGDPSSPSQPTHTYIRYCTTTSPQEYAQKGTFSGPTIFQSSDSDPSCPSGYYSLDQLNGEFKYHEYIRNQGNGGSYDGCTWSSITTTDIDYIRLNQITNLSVKLSDLAVIEQKYNYTFHAPKLEPIQDIYVTEGELIQLNPIAYDSDGDQLIFFYSDPFDENGEWQTAEEDAGEYEIVIGVTDGVFEDYTTVKVVVLKDYTNRLSENNISFDRAGDKVVHLKIPKNYDVNHALIKVGGKTQSVSALLIAINVGTDGRTYTFRITGSHEVKSMNVNFGIYSNIFFVPYSIEARNIANQWETIASTSCIFSCQISRDIPNPNRYINSRNEVEIRIKTNGQLSPVKLYVVPNYPTNPSIDIGYDGDVEWQHIGELKTVETVYNLADEINEHVKICANPDGNYCIIPIKVSSETSGIIKLQLGMDITILPQLTITGEKYNSTTRTATIEAGETLKLHASAISYNGFMIGFDAHQSLIPVYPHIIPMVMPCYEQDGQQICYANRDYTFKTTKVSTYNLWISAIEYENGNQIRNMTIPFTVTVKPRKPLIQISGTQFDQSTKIATVTEGDELRLDATISTFNMLRAKVGVTPPLNYEDKLNLGTDIICIKAPCPVPPQRGILTWQTDYNSKGEYNIEVNATEIGRGFIGETATYQFKVIVLEKNPDLTISSNQYNATTNTITVEAGELIQLTATAKGYHKDNSSIIPLQELEVPEINQYGLEFSASDQFEIYGLGLANPKSKTDNTRSVILEWQTAPNDTGTYEAYVTVNEYYQQGCRYCLRIPDKINLGNTTVKFAIKINEKNIYTYTANPFNPEKGDKGATLISGAAASGLSPSNSDGNNGGFGAAGIVGAAGAFYILNSLGTANRVNAPNNALRKLSSEMKQNVKSVIKKTANSAADLFGKSFGKIKNTSSNTKLVAKSKQAEIKKMPMKDITQNTATLIPATSVAKQFNTKESQTPKYTETKQTKVSGSQFIVNSKQYTDSSSKTQTNQVNTPAKFIPHNVSQYMPYTTFLQTQKEQQNVNTKIQTTNLQTTNYESSMARTFKTNQKENSKQTTVNSSQLAVDSSQFIANSLQNRKSSIPNNTLRKSQEYLSSEIKQSAADAINHVPKLATNLLNKKEDNTQTSNCKLQNTNPKLQTSNFKLLTSNNKQQTDNRVPTANYEQQTLNFKLLTDNYKLQTSNSRPPTTNYELQDTNCKLLTTNYKQPTNNPNLTTSITAALGTYAAENSDVITSRITETFQMKINAIPTVIEVKELPKENIIPKQKNSKPLTAAEKLAQMKEKINKSKEGKKVYPTSTETVSPVKETFADQNKGLLQLSGKEAKALQEYYWSLIPPRQPVTFFTSPMSIPRMPRVYGGIPQNITSPVYSALLESVIIPIAPAQNSGSSNSQNGSEPKQDIPTSQNNMLYGQIKIENTPQNQTWIDQGINFFHDFMGYGDQPNYLTRIVMDSDKMLEGALDSFSLIAEYITPNEFVDRIKDNPGKIWGAILSNALSFGWGYVPEAFKTFDWQLNAGVEALTLQDLYEGYNENTNSSSICQINASMYSTYDSFYTNRSTLENCGFNQDYLGIPKGAENMYRTNINGSPFQAREYSNGTIIVEKDHSDPYTDPLGHIQNDLLPYITQQISSIIGIDNSNKIKNTEPNTSASADLGINNTIDKTKETASIPYTKIYAVMTSLEKQGLLKTTLERPKKYRALSVDTVLDLLKQQKRKELKNVEEIIEKNKDALEKVYTNGEKFQGDDKVWLFPDFNAVWDMVHTISKTAKSELIVMASSEIWNNALYSDEKLGISGLENVEKGIKYTIILPLININLSKVKPVWLKFMTHNEITSIVLPETQIRYDIMVKDKEEYGMTFRTPGSMKIHSAIVIREPEAVKGTIEYIELLCKMGVNMSEDVRTKAKQELKRRGITDY